MEGPLSLLGSRQGMRGGGSLENIIAPGIALDTWIGSTPVCVCVCVCVCWVLGEEKEDSPRLWEACANLTACGCLVV